MPTYDYKCDACGHEFELFQSIKADPIKQCPKCKKLKVKRLIGTGSGVIFKGSGFYTTDYRDKSYHEKAKADVAPSTADAKSETKSDTTTANKIESKPDAKASAKPEAKPATPAPSEPKPSKSDGGKTKEK